MGSMETVLEIDNKWGEDLSKSVYDEIYEKYTLERYLNRTEILIRVSKPDKQTSFNDLWMRIVAQRRQEGRKISLKDQKGNDFWYVMTSHGEKKLQDIDNMGREKLEELTAKETRKLLLADMLIEEAFYSSVIEGAFSTKKRTKELIKTKDPQDKSEQMILNNYQAMIFSLENINEDLNEGLFIAMYKIISYGTLEPDEITEKYRNDIV